MIKIGLDARLYSQTGVGVYIKNFLHFMEKELPQDWSVYVYLMNNDFEKIEIQNQQFIKRHANFKWHGLREQLSFYRLLKKDQLDLMHFTYFSYPIRYKKAFICTIHDLTPLLFRTGRASTKSELIYRIKHRLLKKVFKSQIQNAEQIITPTKAVKKQLVNYYGPLYENKITSIYEGVNEDLIHAKINTNLLKQFPKKFFLYVGNFYPHKNTEKLIRAFAKIRSNELLVLVGPNNFFSNRIEKLIKKLGQEDTIVIFKNPSLEDLAFFYSQATALINPSLSEGFGLPLIEAAYFNCPIIASNIPVFKEILGKSFVSFNPEDVDDIEQKITHFISNPAKFSYKKIIDNFSFENMTKKTLQIYQKCL